MAEKVLYEHYLKPVPATCDSTYPSRSIAGMTFAIQRVGDVELQCQLTQLGPFVKAKLGFGNYGPTPTGFAPVGVRLIDAMDRDLEQCAPAETGGYWDRCEVLGPTLLTPESQTVGAIVFSAASELIPMPLSLVVDLGNESGEVESRFQIVFAAGKRNPVRDQEPGRA